MRTSTSWLIGALILLSTIIITGSFAWRVRTDNRQHLSVITDATATPTVTCRNFEQGTVSVGEQQFKVAIAQTKPERIAGLTGCSELSSGQGMYFYYTEPAPAIFWMKDMSIPLDLIWIVNNQVSGISANLPPADSSDQSPPRYASPGPVDGVLEIGAGEAANLGISIGTPVTLSYFSIIY